MRTGGVQRRFWPVQRRAGAVQRRTGAVQRRTGTTGRAGLIRRGRSIGLGSNVRRYGGVGFGCPVSGGHGGSPWDGAVRDYPRAWCAAEPDEEVAPSLPVAGERSARSASEARPRHPKSCRTGAEVAPTPSPAWHGVKVASARASQEGAHRTGARRRTSCPTWGWCGDVTSLPVASATMSSIVRAGRPAARRTC